ncbi:MAG: hypothetical protein SV760_07790, partial [Halobacteria archaeon]|nr:hypothetical protein [Halobacteria archaeon]
MPSRKFASAVFLALVLGAVLGITFGGLGNPSVERTTRSNTPDVAPISGVDAVSNSSYTRLYSEVIDSVVSVRVDDRGLRSSAGSGFVYDANGHIVTNQHVVGDANQVEV